MVIQTQSCESSPLNPFSLSPNFPPTHLNSANLPAHSHNWTQTLGFLQQNVGVVAACAPCLKPLVGHWLKLSGTTQDHYGSGQRGSSKRSRGLPSNKSGKDDGGGGGFEMMDSPVSNGRFHHQTMIRTGKSPSSSEERIIGWNAQDMNTTNGVLKTTEVRFS